MNKPTHSRISCETFRTCLATAVEQREPPDAQVALHGTTCSRAECRNQYADYQLLESAIAGWRHHRAKLPLSERVVLQLAGRQDDTAEVPTFTVPVNTRSQVFPVIATRRQPRILAASALLLIAAAGSVAWWNFGTVQPEMSIVKTIDAPAAVTTIAIAEPEVAVEPVRPELVPRELDWLEAATDRITSTVAFLIPMDEAPVGMAETSEDAANWADRFRPLGETWKGWFEAPMEEPGML